ESQVKILDFGLAKLVERPRTGDEIETQTYRETAHTRSGMVVGTIAYMSPEQAAGRDVDHRTDIFSLGIVIYQMLTGRRPFDGASQVDTLHAIIHDPAPPFQGIPPGLGDILERALAKDPRERYQHAGALELDLKRETRDSKQAPAALPSVAARWQTAALLSMAMLLLAVGVIGWLTVVRRAAPKENSAAAQTILTQLTNYGGTETSGAISPDGRSFAFVSDHGGTPDIWLRQLSGGEPVRLTNDAAAETDIVFAPDGETIYFTRNENGSPSIWRMGVLGGQRRKVLDGARAPAPSPDGRSIAYSYLDSERAFELTLAVKQLDGGGVRILARGLAGGVLSARSAWSPDSRKLAYSQANLFTPSNLFVVDAGSGKVQQVTRFTRSNQGVSNYAWLPDNRHLAVTYVPVSRQQAANDLGILDAEDGSISRLTLSPAGNFGSLSLSADGSRLLATATRVEREIWKVPVGPDPDANGRAAVRVLDNTQDPMWAFVSKDGRTLLFSNSLTGSRNLWIMPLDRSSPARQVTAIAGEAVSHSSLSPDGKQVAFASTASGNSDIWIQNVDGSDLRQLTDGAAASAWPVWSPDGRSIVFAAQRGGSWETKVISPSGGKAEKLVDGFFRGDWIRQPGGRGTWIVTSFDGGGLRLLDVEKRAVLWEDRRHGGGLSLPMFSPDGATVSIPVLDGRDREAIWVFETATGKSRPAVRFSEPFRIFFRASWVNDGKAFIVNRYRNISHIVLFDRFWLDSEVRH
ncbi:MAG TPA: protein kinase, partial [Bryobacteraceae bacterium]